MAARYSSALRQLIAQRGRFAQQSQNLLARGFERALLLAQAGLQGVALGDFASRRSRAAAASRSMAAMRFVARGQLGRFALVARVQILDFGFARGQRSSMAPICLACDSSRPRVRSASRFSSATRARARRERGVHLIAGFLRARVLLFLGLHFGGEILESWSAPGPDRALVSRLRSPASGSGRKRRGANAQHFGAQLFVALGFRGLALERIRLAADFFQNVEHARQILFGAFELRFGQALARFVLCRCRRLLR